MRRFLVESRDPWISKYNQLIAEVESGGKVFDGKLTLHHIVPRSVDPSLTKDESNWIWLPFAEHMDMHYWLWKHDPQYAPQLWFGCVYGRKHGLWDLPGGEEEYEQLKKDVKKYRKHSKHSS